MNYPIQKGLFPRDDYYFAVENGRLFRRYPNRKPSQWQANEYEYKQHETLLYWNLDERETIDYLVKHHIGTFTTRTEPNWDEDPYGNRVQRGTRTWYDFDFSNL